MTARGDFPGVSDTVTQDAIDAYAELSGDYNPLHVDPVAAAASEFRGIIAHGPIALHALLRSATEWLDVDALPPGSRISVTYRAPTRPGDTITASLTSAADASPLEAACANQDGTTVVTVKATLP